MSENESSQQPDSEADSLLQQKNFGKTLREAREKSGLSVSDIADKILISADLVRAIENSQAEKLPNAAFTQGYIRSYARILGVDADEVIQVYNSVVPDGKQSVSPGAIIKQQHIRDGSSTLLIVTAAIVIALLLFALYQAFIVDGSVNRLFQQATNADEKIVTDTDGSNEFVYDKEMIIDFDDSSRAVNSGDDNAEQHMSIEQDRHIQSSFEQQTQQSIAVETLTDTNIPDTLSISASEDSWCEVRDADDARIIYKLVNAGEFVEINGKAPFLIFMGNARHIKLTINDLHVDFMDEVPANRKTMKIRLGSDAQFLSLN